MVKPNRPYADYQRENPLYLFMQKLENDCGDGISFCQDIGISVNEYLSFITFKMVTAQYESASKTQSLRQYQKELVEEEQGTGIGKAFSAYVSDREKTRSKDLQLRRKFRDAKLKRFNIADIPQYGQLHSGMKDRASLQEGYELTKIQNFQLEDKDDLVITKTFNITRFADSSNTSGKEIKDYYKNLQNKCAERSENSCIENRIIYAINFDKFENENLYGICYRIAQFCFDHKIKITENMESLLVALTGAICCGPIQIHQKPVLLIEKLLPFVLWKSAKDSSAAINSYVMLQIYGLQLRKDEKIIEYLSHIEFTVEDFWEFIYYNYNIFNLYQNIHWDGKGQTISTLRKIAKIVAIKPLS